jgi:hypothetical protein
VLLAQFLANDGEKRYVILIEVQIGQDDDKQSRWPYYLAYAAKIYRSRRQPRSVSRVTILDL